MTAETPSCHQLHPTLPSKTGFFLLMFYFTTQAKQKKKIWLSLGKAGYYGN